MKKIVLLSILGLFALSVFFSSCNKENIDKNRKNEFSQMDKMQIMSSSIHLQVNSDGYLKFNDIVDFNLFSDFLKVNTFGDILNYFDSIEFTPIALDKYPNFDPTSYISEEMMPYFILSANKGMFQIKNTIFKPNEEEQYVLTLNIVNLSEDNLASLNAFNFDENIMNRYTSNGELITQIHPLEILELNPSGINEIPPLDPPMNTMGKFWKNKVVYGECDAGGKRLKTVIRYRFWLRWDDSDQSYVSC